VEERLKPFIGLTAEIAAMQCLKCAEPAYESSMCRDHFREYFERKVRHTIRKFKMFGKNERVGVAVSGGKDSTTLLYVLHKAGYDVVGLTVNAFIGNYTQKNLDNLKQVCTQYSIPLEEISVRDECGGSICYIKSVLNEKGVKASSCMVCGVLRRSLLNKRARQLGLDVVCTGHTMDDEAQAFLMNVFRNDVATARRQGPVSKGGAFVKRAKPFYLTSEKETTAYSKLMGFPVVYERCPCSVDAYRRQFRDFLAKVSEKHPNAANNITQFFLDAVWQREGGETAPNECEECGEPAAGRVCRKCQILGALKKPGI
jgi:uncharacterized protein (TIGR00269 family)